MTNRDTSEVADIRIELKYLQPTVWRKVQLPTSCNLRHLHLIIHQLFGWTGDKEHRFFINYGEYAPPENISEDFFGSSVCNENEKDISSLIGDDTTKFTYTNYFNNKGYWEHLVEIANVQLIEGDAQELVILDGDNASPVENTIGNSSGPSHQKILSDRNHPEHQLISALYKNEWNSLEYDKIELSKKLAELDLN